MSDTPIRLEREGGLATLIPGRPQSLNPLDMDMASARRSRLDEAAIDPTVRAVVHGR